MAERRSRFAARLLVLALALAFALCPARALAVEIGTEGSLASVEVHAFASQGFLLTTSNNYLAAETTHGSFRFTEVGINFTKSLGDSLRLGIQLFAQDLGPTGSFDAKMDWFYLDYHFRDWLGFRAGRVKVPFGLYNEINDIDSARAVVLLPQSVYPIQNRNYLLAQTGGELYGYLVSRGAGALDFRAYCGTIFVDTVTPAGSAYQLAGLTVPYLAGGRLVWETPLDGLRVGGSVQALRLDTQLVSGMQPFVVRIPVVLWVASVEYAAHDLLLAAEYSRWYGSADSTNQMLYPSQPLVTNERAYAMAAYRLTRWLQPSVYYSVLYPNVDQRQGRANMAHDIAATLRFDVNSNWLWKIEGHYMVGTAALTSDINDNQPLSSLARTWALFVVKTTAYF